MPAFNVLMLIPFGMYLRYYFKCGFKKTIPDSPLVSFGTDPVIRLGLSTYPGPYRLADVDDIIQNTTGGGVGYLLGWFLVWLLPTRGRN
ncbi:MAG: VanZ family protein [Streptococcus sp.]